MQLVRATFVCSMCVYSTCVQNLSALRQRKLRSMATRVTRSGRSSLATLVRKNIGRRTGLVLPCAYCVNADITCPSHHVIIDQKPRWIKFLIFEAKVRIIVTRDIGTSVVYHDADEVVYNVILKLQGASEIHRSQDFSFSRP